MNCTECPGHYTKTCISSVDDSCLSCDRMGDKNVLFEVCENNVRACFLSLDPHRLKCASLATRHGNIVTKIFLGVNERNELKIIVTFRNKTTPLHADYLKKNYLIIVTKYLCFVVIV